MTGNDGSRAGLTRRSFLKTAGATVGALGIAGAAGMTATSDWFAPTQAYAEPRSAWRIRLINRIAAVIAR